MTPDRYVVERHTIDIAYGFRVRDTMHPEETHGFGLRRETADDLAAALNAYTEVTNGPDDV